MPAKYDFASRFNYKCMGFAMTVESNLICRIGISIKIAYCSNHAAEINMLYGLNGYIKFGNLRILISKNIQCYQKTALCIYAQRFPSF